MNYPVEDNLVPLTQLAANLGFTPAIKENFNEEDYIPIEFLDAKLLYSDTDFQRLINEALIRKVVREAIRRKLNKDG